jgi:hypothetical protein
MSHGTQQVEEALRVLRHHLKYVVQVRNRLARGAEGAWHTRTDLGCIVGKSEAYDVMNAEKEKNPGPFQWRVLPQNEADRYQQGVEVGKKLAREELV